MLDPFLASLRRQAEGRLAPTEVDALVFEARDHLEQSIQARLEIGSSPEEAEREAIVAFGSVHRVVLDLAERAAAPHQKARDRRLLAAYALFIFGIVVGPGLMRWSEGAYHAIFVFAWLSLAAFATASFQTRRSAPVRVVRTGLAAAFALWIALGVTWLDFYPYGGLGMAPRWEVNRYLAQTRREGATDSIAAVPMALADPVGNLLSFAPEALPLGTVAAATGGAIDLAFAGLGALVYRLRRSRRPTVA